MKLRNLMYATMIACAFASCSKDDENVPGGETAEGDATLEVNLNIKSTKALNGDAVGDASINDLTLIVFNRTTGVSEAVVLRDGADVNKGAGAISVKTVVTGGAKQVVVLANAKNALETASFTKGNTLDELKAVKNTLSSETTSNLTMNSALYDVDLTPGAVNYLGYGSLPGSGENLNTQVGDADYANTIANGIVLYRNVAKVSLNKIEFDVDAAQYPGAKFTMSDVYILHAKQQTNIMGLDGKEWGSTEVSGSKYFNGVANSEYVDYVNTMKNYFLANNKFEKIFNYLTETDQYTQIEGSGIILTAGKTFEFSDGNTLTNQDGTALNTFYVYENTNTTVDTVAISTLLVVKGTFTFGKVNEVRYYSLAVGRTSNGKLLVPAEFLKLSHGRTITEGRPDVLRNLQYNVDLKITGMGYTTPFGPKDPDGADKAVLDVQCQVAAWGQVAQTPEI